VSQPADSGKLSPNQRTILFVVVLCLTCAIILAVLAYLLKGPQERARELDRSKQMLTAVQAYNPLGYFQIPDAEGKYVPAKYDSATQVLVPGTSQDMATADQILTVYNNRIKPALVNAAGEIKTFQEAGINQETYISDNKKTGYATLPWKLIYAILPNLPPKELETIPLMKAEGYLIPVAGFGLWDAIYGYIAVANDGDKVIGITWYSHAETPGLGAVIAEPSWQAQFPGKLIFQEDAQGQTDFATAPMGITVVRGKVSEVYGTSPKSLSAVDGIAGATITGNGVSKAYKDSLTPYRAFLIKLHQDSTGGKK
jgi:Na+-transporting NADH:ubiquinone oxidoreductase subunit C